ncbi:hypothetical protein [Parasphingopyxis sp.]|uniref:hypothetical protein n=1 Tax=Parasphingopyxis sp. TaxID=1920299 RepID=UPI00260737D9|nr:hypothetical protein [Parasphingopyxis sp.]
MRNSPKIIYLHIGSPKTGSSFIQSSLANAEKTLADHKIHYPIDETESEKARNGLITSGNFYPKPGAFTALIERGRQSDLPGWLISSESIFQLLVREGSGFLDRISAECPDAEIKTLVYLRDPVDHVVSGYQQRVKRGGFTGTLADFMQSYRYPSETKTVLRQLRKCGADTTVLNYTRHKKNLLATFENWLGLVSGSLPRPPVNNINRSLTNSELKLQLIFNAHFGGLARRFVSDPLCHALPDIKSETPPLSRDELTVFLERMHSEMEDPEYLELVPAEEHPRPGEAEDYIARFSNENRDDQFVFSADQIHAVAEALSDELKRYEKRAGLSTAPAGTEPENSDENRSIFIKALWLSEQDDRAFDSAGSRALAFNEERKEAAEKADMALGALRSKGFVLKQSA